MYKIMYIVVNSFVHLFCNLYTFPYDILSFTYNVFNSLVKENNLENDLEMI